MITGKEYLKKHIEESNIPEEHYENEIGEMMEWYADDYHQEQLRIGCVIWRCTQNIQDIYGETIFTKGLVYEQIKIDEYPMMLIDNKVEESEVYNFKDYFTSI